MLPDVTVLPEFAAFVAARDSHRWYNASFEEVPPPMSSGQYVKMPMYSNGNPLYVILPRYTNDSAPVQDADMYRTLQRFLSVGAMWCANNTGQISVYVPHLNFYGMSTLVCVETPEERRSRLQAEIDEEKREAFLELDEDDEYGDEDELEDDLNEFDVDFEDEDDDEDDDYDD